MFDIVDPERMNYFCKKTIENEKVLESNGKLWSTELDRQLKEFVILYNFNFYEVANRFHSFLSEKKKYEFTEDEIRRHWAFIHAARYLNMCLDETYYEAQRTKYKVEEFRKRKVTPEEEKQIDLEQKRINEKIEQMRYDRFNLISVRPDNEDNKLIINENLGNEENKQDLNENFNNTNNIKCDEVTTTPSIANANASDLPNETNAANTLNNQDEEDDVIHNLFKINKKTRDLETETKYKEKNEQEDITAKGDYEESLFPISTKPTACPEVTTETENPNDTSVDDDLYRQIKMGYKIDGIDRDIEKTKTIDDFIKEDDKLREQYENLNTYYNFAVKSLNYFIPKLGKGLENQNDPELEAYSENPDQFENNVIKKTSEKINNLFLNSMKEASEKIAKMSVEEYNKKLEDEEKAMEEHINNHNVFSNLNVEEPEKEDQEQKLSTFRSYLFSEAQKVSTPQLLSQIVDIINNTYIDEVKMRNDDEEEEENTNANETVNSQVTESTTDGAKKYKHYYRGVEYYSDKPPKEHNSDDSYVEDD